MLHVPFFFFFESPPPRAPSSRSPDLLILCLNCRPLPLTGRFGITDDDLRETAFEILLACAGASGGLIVPSKEKKNEKRRSRLIKSLVAKISEAMDIRTRQRLLNALAGKSGKRMDSLLVPLELLCCVSRTEFSDKKAYLRWQKRQLNMLAEGLINHPVVGFGESGRKATDLKSLLQRIEESESLPSSAGEVQRAECLKSLTEVATSLAERPARGDLTGEVCHWADGYHLNVRLYEKLLLCVFDMLNEGKLTEEVEEILELLKSTWRVLGITETIHYTCYAWVLFRQYVITSEQGLLRHAIQQLNKIPLKEQRGPQERIHLKTLQCRVENEEISFLESFLSPIRSWADKQTTICILPRISLLPYLNCTGSLVMEDTVTVAMITWRLLLEESDRAMHSSSLDREQIESYISSSIKNTFTRMSLTIDRSDRINEHPLALLAEETKKLMKKESTIFMPILSQRHPQAIAFSASLIHKFYGNKLKPFLDGTEHLTEDVVSVFPAADSLEQYLLRNLGALLRGIDNAFQVYTNHVMEKLGSKDDLVPPVPVLTRYKKEAAIKVFVKKELFESKLPDERWSTNIDVPASAVLCVQLNTLHYAVKSIEQVRRQHMGAMDSKKTSRKDCHHSPFIRKSLVEKTKSVNQKESFEGSRKDINAALDRICEFTGTKIIFCDLREPFIENLYKPSVSQSRLEALIEGLDTDGLLRVLLDGGPSRVFHPSESKLLEEDVEVLKEFFISGGDGLPRGVAENQIARVRLVTRELIDDLRSRSSLDMQQGGRGKLGADTQTMVRVLCHRNDSEASLFLKKQYKIPKSHA
ncbi:hypothetical protein Bca4012_069436 [Brassica carinata]